MYSLNTPLSRCNIPTPLLLFLSLLILLLCRGVCGEHVTQEEKQYIMHVHNAERMASGAKTMGALMWDMHVARRAQALAEECGKEISTHYGHNAAFHSTMRNASLIVEQWAAEKRYYDVRDNTCTHTCEHYKQIVWETSRSVGCGVSTCAQGSINLVCLYWPSGNLNLRPYKYNILSKERRDVHSEEEDTLPASAEDEDLLTAESGRTLNDNSTTNVSTSTTSATTSTTSSVQTTGSVATTTNSTTSGSTLTSGKATTTTGSTQNSTSSSTITSGGSSSSTTLNPCSTTTTKSASTSTSSSSSTTSASTTSTTGSTTSKTSTSTGLSSTGVSSTGVSSTGLSSSTGVSSTGPSSTTGTGGCCQSCSMYAFCNTDQCACECLAGFYGTGQSCQPIGDPIISTSRWEYEDDLEDTWNIDTNANKITHTGAYSRAEWSNLIYAKFGASFSWEASVTPLSSARTWGLIFKSYDMNNMYLIECNTTYISLGAYYKSVMYQWTVSPINWTLSVTKELKVHVDGSYYSVFLDGERIPANKTFSQNTVAGESGESGLMGVYAQGDVVFNDMLYTSSEEVTVHVSACPSVSTINTLLSSIGILPASYDFEITLDPSCFKRSYFRSLFNNEDSSIVFQLYGNSSHSAITLSGILSSSINGQQDIFAANGLPVVSVDSNNPNATVDQADVVVLHLDPNPDPHPIPIDSSDDNGLSKAITATIIVLALCGFSAIVAIVAVYIYRRKRPYTRRLRGPEVNSMHIPQYPEGPLTLDKKKKKKRGTVFDILGLHSTPAPGKSDSQIVLKADDL